jgi:DNA polymerase IV
VGGDGKEAATRLKRNDAWATTFVLGAVGLSVLWWSGVAFEDLSTRFVGAVVFALGFAACTSDQEQMPAVFGTGDERRVSIAYAVVASLLGVVAFVAGVTHVDRRQRDDAGAPRGHHERAVGDLDAPSRADTRYGVPERPANTRPEAGPEDRLISRRSRWWGASAKDGVGVFTSEETMEALHDVVRSGKARYIGASSMCAWQFAKAQRVAPTPFVSMQNHYNLVYREEEREMIPQCVDQGVAVLPWSPLARGLLAGNRTREGERLTTRARTDGFGDSLYTPEVDFAVVDRVAEVASARRVSSAQVALAWSSTSRRSRRRSNGPPAPVVGAGEPGSPRSWRSEVITSRLVADPPADPAEGPGRSWTPASVGGATLSTMVAEATILHADVDSFYASVEQRDDPSLQGRPVIVGAGVVLAASYEAKAFGVRTPMGGAQARRLCPQAIVVRPRMEAYSEASKALFAVFEDTTPFVEGLSIDEAFLDVGGLRMISGTPTEIATRLRGQVLERVGLPVTVGVARTKFLAKVASGVAKPDGLLVVPPDRELAFLHPLPVEALWGVGPVTGAKLRERAVTTVEQVARLGEATLVRWLGQAAGRHLHALAHNRDPRPVQVGRRRRSMGTQRALGRRRRAPEELDADLVALVDRLSRRLRKAHRVTRSVTLRLRFDDFSRATRSHTIHEATALTETLLATGRGLLSEAMPMIHERGITLIGITFSNLSDDRAIQLALPLDGSDADAIDLALDRVKERFGSDAVTRAVLLGRRQGVSVPLLPD